MIPLNQALFNLGDRIVEIIGKDQYKALKALDKDTSDQESLVKLCINIHTEWGVLRNKEYRNIILNSLSIEDAKELALVLGITYEKNPYKNLRNKVFRKNSKQEEYFFGFFGLSLPEAEIEEYLVDTIKSVKAKYGLFKHQRNALMGIEDILNNGGGRAVLHMPTGSGKTRTAMNLAARQLNKYSPTTVLWLAHSEELCEQAAQEFERAWEFLGDRDVTLRRFFKSHDWEDTKDGMIIAGLQKMWNFVKNTETGLHQAAPGISLVIFDEAHQSISPTYRLIIDIITTRNPNCKFLGLTATPGRTWNDIDKDMELSNFYNRKKVTLNVEGYSSPIDYLVKEKFLSEPDFHKLEVDSVLELSETEIKSLEKSSEYSEDILKKLSSDGHRNSLIIMKVQNLIDKHERILIFATNVSHARTINSLLNFCGIKSEVVTSNTEDSDRKNAISMFKEMGGEPMVLCNYGVLTTGFDAPLTSAAIIARPTKSLVLYSQMVGRVIRGPRVGGTHEAEIWTVIDTSLPGFDSLTGAFTNWEDVWRD
jgi:superfamily II DNA or RNA helicase